MQIATTAFVKAAIAAMMASVHAVLDTQNEQLTAFSHLTTTQNTFPYFDSNIQLSLANISEVA